MRALTASELLDVWDEGRDRSSIERGLRLLAVACPATERSAVAQWSIGERDARLLQLREGLFGSRLVCTAICPHCGERLEWESDVSTLRLQAVQPVEPGRILELRSDPYVIRYRLPNSDDMLRAVAVEAYRTDTRRLLDDCIVEIQGLPEAGVVLPDEVYRRLDAAMADADPQADIAIALTCPACAFAWSALFDILSYLCAEIDNWAHHTLVEVYTLARGFGWSERDILAMSARRRQLYLELLRT
jgi:hypothetical protein